jgi:hypothetical protein
MAHYAILDENNVVVQVITGKDEHEGDEDWEAVYAEFSGATVKRTSYNTSLGVHKHGGTPFRKNYAGIGYSYDAERDAFIPPKPFASWILDEFSCTWQPPVAYPTDVTPGEIWVWDEVLINWRKL